MIYSCFDQSAGLYDYYEDSSTRPINGDLPIPELPASTGKIGVPAIEAGRPLPINAKKVGQGWHARGMVVQCRNTSLGQTESSGLEWTWWKAAGAGALAGLAVSFVGRDLKRIEWAGLGGVVGIFYYAFKRPGGA